jgi:hypothetical protein
MSGMEKYDAANDDPTKKKTVEKYCRLPSRFQKPLIDGFQSNKNLSRSASIALTFSA